MSAINVKSKHGPYSDLEFQQYSNLYRALDVPLKDVRKKNFAPMVSIALFAITSLVILAAIVKIPNYILLPIRLENHIEEEKKILNHNLIVNQYFVSIGDSIKKGDPICEINSFEIEQSISELVEAQNRLKQVSEFGSEKTEVLKKNLNNRKLQVQKSAGSIESERASFQRVFSRQHSKLLQEIEYHHSIIEQHLPLAKEGAISQLEFRKLEQQYQEKKMS